MNPTKLPFANMTLPHLQAPSRQHIPLLPHLILQSDYMRSNFQEQGLETGLRQRPAYGQLLVSEIRMRSILYTIFVLNTIIKAR